MTPDQPSTPAPGWYPDPSDRTQVRRWDGVGWTSESRPVAQLQDPAGTKFAIAVPVGVAVGVVLSGVLMQRSTESAAYVLGESVAWGLFAGVGAGLVSVVAPFRWRWWYYPPVAVALWFVVFGVLTLKESSSASGRSNDRVELVAPHMVGSLELVETEDLENRRAMAEKQFRLRSDGDESVVMGQYAAPGHDTTLVFMGINTALGSEFDDETMGSPAKAVRGFLTGAGIQDAQRVEPGQLGGTMMCGPGRLQSVDVFACAWSTAGVVGFLTFDSAINPDEATQQTHAFRELAEHPR